MTKVKKLFGGQEDSILVEVKKQLELAELDPEIKAVILKINSPGGSVTASDIIYREILQFKTKKKIPVVSLLWILLPAAPIIFLWLPIF